MSNTTSPFSYQFHVHGAEGRVELSVFNDGGRVQHYPKLSAMEVKMMRAIATQFGCHTITIEH